MATNAGAERINRFSRILKTRAKLREDEQVLLGAHRREEDGVLRAIVQLDEEKKSAFKEFSAMSEGALLSRQEIWFQRQVFDVIDKHLTAKEISLTTVRQKITDTEKRLIERHRDVKIIDKHIENLTISMHETVRFHEQEEIDDVATIRFDPKEEQ